MHSILVRKVSYDAIPPSAGSEPRSRPDLVYSPFSESGQQINGNNEAVRRFGRQWQLGLRLAF